MTLFQRLVSLTNVKHVGGNRLQFKRGFLNLLLSNILHKITLNMNTKFHFENFFDEGTWSAIRNFAN